MCVCWGGQGGQGWGSHTGRELMLAAGLCTHHDSIYQLTLHDWSQATANGPITVPLSSRKQPVERDLQNESSSQAQPSQVSSLKAEKAF